MISHLLIISMLLDFRFILKFYSIKMWQIKFLMDFLMGHGHLLIVCTDSSDNFSKILSPS